MKTHLDLVMTDISEVTDTQALRATLHTMIGIAFVEIRAAETVHLARKTADIFHVLPTALLNCTEKADYEAAFKHLLDRAARHGMQDYIQKLQRTAMT